jgi:hypothetical protein
MQGELNDHYIRAGSPNDFSNVIQGIPNYTNVQKKIDRENVNEQMKLKAYVDERRQSNQKEREMHFKNNGLSILNNRLDVMGNIKVPAAQPRSRPF